MRRIRPRTRVDTLMNQQRADPVRWGRRVYLAVLGGLALLGADYAIGDALVLRAEGMVVNERHVVAATYAARVAAVRVREGAPVAPGDVLVELESPEMLRDIAQAAAQGAELAVREAQLKTRAGTVAALLPLAERHARESADVVGRLDRMAGGGLVTLQRVDQALGSGFDTALRLATLRGEAAVLAGELPLVARARERAAETLGQLEAFYEKGLVRAPRAGAVGPRVPAPGQVVRFGDELLQVHGAGAAAVLAYLPDMYLFPLATGDRVEVRGGGGGGGGGRVQGVVEALLPVADALPPEFQSMFRPRDRNRLVRIRLPESHGFAVSQKVGVRGCVLGWCWRWSLLGGQAGAWSG